MATALALPPSYEPPPGDSLTNPLIDVHLPDYTPRDLVAAQPAGDREFEYTIERKKGETFACLKVVAATAYSKNIPTISGAGPVKGSVHLYLKQPETITSVAISIRGRFLPAKVPEEEYRLFEISNTLWSKEMDATVAQPLLQKTKLSGEHSWAFSVPIPQKIQFYYTRGKRTPGHVTTEYDTPQTLNEKGILSADIRYEAVLRIGRGKFKPDKKAICTFGYTPVMRPPPFPPLKTIAYREGTSLLGPSVDVDSWVAADAVCIPGTLFNNRHVTIDCQLFLSLPLTYTRGSVIPLYLRMQSSDRMALDLLATNREIKVRLQRKIRYSIPMSMLKSPDAHYETVGKDIRDLVEAVWWPDPSQGQQESSTDSGSHTVYLNGELHLPANLIPTSTFPICTVKYFVSMRPFDAPGFKMESADKVLLDHPVNIVTAYASGPRPVRSAPPQYNSEHLLTAHDHGVSQRYLFNNGSWVMTSDDACDSSAQRLNPTIV